MINKDFSKYAALMWQNDTYMKPISEISKSGKGKPPLVNSSKIIYYFDKISDKIYDGNNKPHSVDGLFFSKNTAYFVEFKTGFKKKRTKKNFQDKYAECPKFKCFCEDYKDWFFKMQDKETEELKNSIKFKAIESYITFEKHILPFCIDTENKYRIELIVVIDEDEIDDYENNLLDLSGQYVPSNTEENNCFCSLSKSLQNYKVKKDKQFPSNDYFYDDIKVLSAKGFQKFFDELFSETLEMSNV